MKMDVGVDFSGALADLDGMAERASKSLRYAAFQGVEMLRDEIRLRAPRSEKTHWFYSKGSRNADGSKRKYEFHPGDLKKSVFAYFDKAESSDGLSAIYQVGWRHNEGQKAKFGGTAIKAVPYGYMVHNGVNRGSGRSIAARPFVVQAWASVGDAVERRMVSVLKDAVLNGKGTD